MVGRRISERIIRLVGTDKCDCEFHLFVGEFVLELCGNLFRIKSVLDEIVVGLVPNNFDFDCGLLFLWAVHLFGKSASRRVYWPIYNFIFFQIQKVISAVHRIEQTKYKIDLRTLVNLICLLSISVRKFTSLNSLHRFINFLCKLPIKNSISVPRDFFTLTTIFLVG